METATLLGGTLQGIDSVRILVVTNRKSLIPSWVKARVPKVHTERSENTTERFIDEGSGCNIAPIFDALWEHGFRPVRTHQQPAKGDDVRVGITFERTGKPITQARLAELAPLFGGFWSVQANRNSPLGEVPDSITLKCHFRGYKGTDRANAVNITEDGVIALF